jgi:hypothetical protein
MLKRIFIATFLGMLTIVLGMSCSPDNLVNVITESIKVSVQARASTFPGLPYDAEVIFEFTKDGGERFTITRTIPSNGRMKYAEVSYDLHPGEVIQVTAKLQGAEASKPAEILTTTYEEVKKLARDDGSGNLTGYFFADFELYVVRFWDLTGKWVLRVNVEGGATYTHDYEITQTGGALTGTGGVPAGGRYDNREKITGTNGMTVTGPITIKSAYDNGTYVYELKGTIDKIGRLSGTWVDNYNPVHKGTFSTIDGLAEPIP